MLKSYVNRYAKAIASWHGRLCLMAYSLWLMALFTHFGNKYTPMNRYM